MFKPGKLTFGLIAPFKDYPDTPIPDVYDLGESARLAEKGGFAALWIRDVPFYDPRFGDVGQGLDPFVTLGYLAAKTKKIALGTGRNYCSAPGTDSHCEGGGHNACPGNG